MSVKYTRQGCKVETTCIINPNGTFTENVVLSVDPASPLSLAVEERAHPMYVPPPAKVGPKLTPSRRV